MTATVKLSREQHVPIKLAAATATGNLLMAELQEQLPASTAMEPLIPVLVALLGQDQTSEVQRQGLQVSQVDGSSFSSSLNSDLALQISAQTLCMCSLRSQDCDA